MTGSPYPVTLSDAKGLGSHAILRSAPNDTPESAKYSYGFADYNDDADLAKPIGRSVILGFNADCPHFQSYRTYMALHGPSRRIGLQAAWTGHAYNTQNSD